jgi:hypothetical protein
MKIYQFGSVCFAAVAMLLLGSTSRADIVFNFVESGGQVTMTYSGTLDTNNMTAGFQSFSSGTFFWGEGVGTTFDVIGVAGPGAFTNAYEWTPTDQANFATAGTITNYFSGANPGSTPFVNIAGPGNNQPGVGLMSANIDGNGIWTGMGGANIAGTLASIGLNPGTTITHDANSGERLIFNISSVPEPSCLCLLGLGFAGLVLQRRRRPTLMQS